METNPILPINDGTLNIHQAKLFCSETSGKNIKRQIVTSQAILLSYEFSSADGDANCKLTIQYGGHNETSKLSPKNAYFDYEPGSWEKTSWFIVGMHPTSLESTVLVVDTL